MPERSQVKPGVLLEATGRLLAHFLGKNPTVLTDFAPAFELLLGGEAEIPVEMPWEETYNDVRYERRVIILKNLNEAADRVIFFNPASRHDLPPGTPLGGEDMGPPRRIEEGGLESMELDVIVQFFIQGRAYALVP
jgi:hypothetical protein